MFTILVINFYPNFNICVSMFQDGKKFLILIQSLSVSRQVISEIELTIIPYVNKPQAMFLFTFWMMKFFFFRFRPKMSVANARNCFFTFQNDWHCEQGHKWYPPPFEQIRNLKYLFHNRKVKMHHFSYSYFKLEEISRSRHIYILITFPLV